MTVSQTIERMVAFVTRVTSHRTLGVGTGALAGMGAFMYSNEGLLPPAVPGWVPVVVLCLAGVYTVVLSTSLSRSIRALLIAFVTAIGTLFLASVLPVWVLPYGRGGADIALVYFLRQALLGTLMALLVIFLGSYFATLFVAGYFDW